MRFVILEHDWPTRHWDLLLEAGPVLRAWRLLCEPAVPGEIPAEVNADHRLFYLDYEGPVAGGRGNVARWAAGNFEWVKNESNRVEVELVSERLTARVAIAGGVAAFQSSSRSGR